MAKIPGVVFVLIGVLFSFFSHYINKLQKTNSLTLFVYVGYGFIAYGVAKVVIGYILKKDKKGESEDAFKDQLPEEESTSQIVAAKKAHKSDLFGYIGYCPRCNTPMRKINRYCHRCGVRQKTQ